MLRSRFSFLGTMDSNKDVDLMDGLGRKLKPTLSIQTDKDVYRPGDSIFVTIQVSNVPDRDHDGGFMPSLLIERLSFELKGVEKLDIQWFSTQKPSPGSEARRGEHIFLDSSTPSLISNQLLSSGSTKTLMVRAVLPDIIPPSYRGATVRYLYYVKSTLCGRWLTLENSQIFKESRKDFTKVETRIPLQVWVVQKNNGLLSEESQNEGIVPTSTIQTEIYWKEMDGDSEWARANDAYASSEEGYDSSRDEISSVSSYPNKGNLQRTYGSSLSLQSGARLSMKDTSYTVGECVGLSPSLKFSGLSVAEVLYDSGADGLSPGKSPNYVIPSQQQPMRADSAGVPLSPEVGAGELVPSEGFTRGRSYNIRMDDQVLLRFSPKNADSTYYFSDTIGGTLTFFHEEGARRCLEVSVTLETSETISRQFVHPSRRNSPMLTKVQSDHHEVVADLVQTSFLFSIPIDGPMSFATPHVSIQWILRFEFLTTPKNVDLTRYEHPLLIEERDRSEWVLPITVHAPPPRTPPAAQNPSEKLYGFGGAVVDS